ncbi:MAG: DUF1559 domain-containing protein [Planctomycetales bacterium]|nr:DUF1559 domain-containing protein [Planctomycetales bacterium]
MIRYEQWFLLCLVASQLLLAGCGGNSQDEMRRHAIRRKPATEEAEPSKPAPAEVAGSDEPPELLRETTQNSSPNAVTGTPPVNVLTPKLPPASEASILHENAGAIPYAKPPAEPLSPAERRERTADNMQAIGNAWRSYLDAKGYFPGPVASVAKEPLLSWRVELLPYLGLQSLYDAFHLDESWDSPDNIALLEQIPQVFQSPDRFDTSTNYLALSLGGTTVHQATRKVTERNVEDGIENTLALVEVDEDHAVPWTKPAELPLIMRTPLKSLGKLRENGFFAVWSNGQASWIDGSVDPELFAKACTIDAGDGFRGSQIAHELAIGIAVPVDDAADTPENETVTAVPINEPNPMTITPSRPSLSDVQKSLLADSNTSPERHFQKQPIPPASDLKVARDLLRELYQADYAAATTVTQRLQLARKMLDRMPDLGGDVAGQYAMLEIVQQIAIQAGRAEMALNATNQLNARFELKSDPLLDAFEKLARTTKDRRSQDQLLKEAEAVFDELVFDEQFEEAERLSQLAVAVANKASDKDVVDKFTSRRNWAGEAKELQQAARDGLATLDQNPEDPRANGDVGKFLCLVKGDWDNGLVILANGDDRSLKRLAEMELSDLSDAMRQLELADLWWREAELESPAFKATLQSRAKHWYEQSLSGLPAGLVRIRVERRIEELGKRAA